MSKEYDLARLAEKVMRERGLQPEFSKAAIEQLYQIDRPAAEPNAKDLRSLLWCSIDNDDTRDLDQLTFAERQDGQLILWIAVADVDALVHRQTPIDLHAAINTTSVYTPAKNFPMLPEKLSTNLTSLNENEDRLALVIRVPMLPDGEIGEGSIFHAMVHNHAKLAYPSVGAWLEKKGPMPAKIGQVPGLMEALQLQHEAAQKMRNHRHALGALTLRPFEIESKLKDDMIILMPPSRNFADQLIEYFMIAANHVMATVLRESGWPSLRRIVRVPKRWPRIIELAQSLGESLPEHPDSKALETFLVKRKNADPAAFPHLSLVVVKLLGRGEYEVETYGKPTGHFGLALSEYTHSTAPNRRFPDLITQRQYKALCQKKENPYSFQELKKLAEHCTKQEDAASKVQRHLNKSAAALLLSSKIGALFKGLVIGKTEKGTWIRVFDPHVEGKIIQGFEALDVGHRISVKLVSVDIEKGYIDFAAVK